MPDKHIRHKRRSFSASHAVEKAGEILSRIKSEDNLTFADLGVIIGKSRYQAERIAKGNAVMDMPTFLRACDYWGERFADKVLALAGLRAALIGSICSSDGAGGLVLAKLLPAILEAEADRVVKRAELAPHEALIRAVHNRTAEWLDLIARPDAEPLRVVG